MSGVRWKGVSLNCLPSMSVNLVHPAAEKIALILEGIGDDKVRVNSSSLDHSLVVLQALEIVGIAKKVMVGRVKRSAYWLNHDPSGLATVRRQSDGVTPGCDGVT